MKKENEDLRLELDQRSSEIGLLKTQLRDLKAGSSPKVFGRETGEIQQQASSVYLKNVLVSFMSSRDPREQLGMVKAIGQLAGFTSAETEKVRGILEEADAGMFGKLVTFTRGVTTPQQAKSPHASTEAVLPAPRFN